MTPERHEQIANLYYRTLELSPGQRLAFLETECAGDDVLRREVESLLDLDESAKDFIELPALSVAAELLAEEAPPLESGTMVGFYHVLSSLGAGGMGEVYLAEDTRLGRKIALKLLPANFTKEPARLHRFEQEARTTSALNHPNIITIHDIGEVGGRPFIATEFVSGETLRQRLAQGPMPLEATLDMAIQVANALAAAHHAGVVHRDIKPENIMLRTDGYIKVLDFGLAKLTQSTEPDDEESDALMATKSLTTSLVAGTVKYMSPEQALGQKVDARSDIFSLGIVLYEMLSGRLPFAADTREEVIAAIVAKEPPFHRDFPDLSQPVKRIIDKSLRKNRDERYQTAEELIADLKSVRQSWGPGGRTTRKRRRWPIVAAIAVILVVVGLFYYRMGLSVRRAESAEARRLYDEGRLEWDQVTEETLHKSIELFLEAKEKDPSFSLPYSGLADAYSLLGEISAMEPKEAFSHARVYAEKALSLDPSLAEAWISLGIARLFYDWDWKGAEDAFSRARALNPQNPHLHHFYGHYLQFMGRTKEAIDETRQAVELAPKWLLINTELGWAYYGDRQYDLAIAESQRTLAHDPAFAYASWVMAQAYEQQRKYREALEELTKAKASSPDWPWIVADTGYVYGKIGRHTDALKIIAELQEQSKKVYIDPVLIAYIYIALDDRDQAFAWLEKAFREHAALIPWIKFEPKFDDLRGDARFADLVQRIGLPQ